jgi:hypothetical protein
MKIKRRFLLMDVIKGFIYGVVIGGICAAPMIGAGADTPTSIAEHWDVTWQALIGVMILCTGLVGILYRQAVKRIEGVEASLSQTATKSDIEALKLNCANMQTNCPKNGTLLRIEEILKQNAVSIEAINSLNKRILERQDDLRKELPEDYIRRVEYEKRHESLERTINTSFTSISAQLTDLSKSISETRGAQSTIESLTSILRKEP